MIMKKKLFIAPELQVLHICAADILCTSPETFSIIDEEQDKEEDVW